LMNKEFYFRIFRNVKSMLSKSREKKTKAEIAVTSGTKI